MKEYLRYPSTGSENKTSLGQKILFLLLCTLFTGAISIFSLFSLRALLYPHTTHYTEGHILALADLLKKNKTYFFNIQQPPYIHAIYPPVYIGLISLFPTTQNPYFIGRFISLLSTIFIVFFLYKICIQYTEEKFLALFFSLFFLIPDIVIKNAVRVRTDMLALLFTTIGLFIYTRWREKKNLWRFICIPFFLLAFFTKQHYLLAPITIILYTGLKNKKGSAVFSLFFFLPLAGLSILLHTLTDGQFFLHTILYTANMGIYSGRFLSFLQIFLQLFPLFFILFLFQLWYTKNFSLWSLYCLMTLVIFLTFIRGGVLENFYLEPFLALLLVSSMMFFRLWKKFPHLRTLLLGALVIQCFIALPLRTYTEVAAHPIKPSFSKNISLINNYIRAFPGEILAEDVGMVYSTGQKILYEPFGLLWLSRNGYWDSSPMIQNCLQEKFSLIIAGKRLMQFEGLPSCLKSHYKLLGELQGFYYADDGVKIYIPANKARQ